MPKALDSETGLGEPSRPEQRRERSMAKGCDRSPRLGATRGHSVLLRPHHLCEKSADWEANYLSFLLSPF